VPPEARTLAQNPDQIEEALTAQEFTRRAAGLPGADQGATTESYSERAFGTFTDREDRASDVVARMQAQRREGQGGGWNPNRGVAGN
jgi:hypothetical protein